jgi:hypothetical protein
MLTQGHAQTITDPSATSQLNTITTAVPFLLIRGNAYEMGAANVGVVSSAFYHETAFTSNAALLANGHQYLSVNNSYNPWLRALVPKINMTAHSVAGTINKRHALGLYFKHFSLGNIAFTDNAGNSIGAFNPTEYVVQLNYAHWFPMGLSIGVAGKYIHSNLTGGINIGGTDTKSGIAGALDFGLSYRKKHQVSDLVGIGGTFGFGLNNIGNKISYTNTNEEDFLPMNMMLGAQLNLGIAFKKVRFEHDLAYQVTKLLVPTPPVYDPSLYLDNSLPSGSDPGEIDHPSNGNPAFGQIIAGTDPNVGVFEGIGQSFNDAPGGTKEEWNEVIHQVSHEFRFIYNDFLMLGFREGFFYEHETKGNRQFVSLGASVGVAGFRLDAGRWIPLQRRSPLENTVFVSLSYRISLEAAVKKMRFPKWNAGRVVSDRQETAIALRKLGL